MGWWKTAKPGDKVVCVNDQWGGKGLEAKNGIRCPLIAGAVYTVAKFGMCTCFSPEGEYGTHQEVELAEVKHPHSGGFHVNRFRPVQTKSTETGMAILKAILNGAPVSEDA